MSDYINRAAACPRTRPDTHDRTYMTRNQDGKHHSAYSGVPNNVGAKKRKRKHKRKRKRKRKREL